MDSKLIQEYNKVYLENSWYIKISNETDTLETRLNYAPFGNIERHNTMRKALSEEAMLGIHLETISLIEDIISRVAPGKGLKDLLDTFKNDKEEETHALAYPTSDSNVIDLSE